MAVATDGVVADFPLEEVQTRFPAIRGSQRIVLDGPGGTQLCGPAIDAVRAHCEAGRPHESTHEAVADLLPTVRNRMKVSGQKSATLSYCCPW